MVSCCRNNTAVDLGATLGIENQYEGRCGTCANENYPDATGGQCRLSSGHVLHFDTCGGYEKIDNNARSLEESNR